jgi:hypothetical protein
MMQKIFIRLSFVVLAVLIVLPVNSSVKQLSSNGSAAPASLARSGNPLPMPTPPGLAALRASGNPLPMPTPPGFSALSPSGNPLPMPTPPGFTAQRGSGNPLPMPTPPGLSALEP